MIAGGVQIIVSRNVDSRATYVVGVSLLLGLAREIFPTYFKQVAPVVHLFTGSMMSIGVMSAFVLNLIFRIGATRSPSANAVLLRLDGFTLLDRLPGRTNAGGHIYRGDRR
jgi:xanthine/uracil permease